MKKYDDMNQKIPKEKPAVKTTIVGGRPPGSGKETASVPQGIEVLVKKASVDSNFKEALLKERSVAASHIDLILEDSEINLLNTVPQSHLEGMISATKVSPNMRKIFLGCTASVMLAALTTTTSTARVYSGGISPHMDDIFTEEPIEIQKKIKPYYKEAGIDVYLGTGTLEVEVIDRSSGRPLDEIEVHFVKKYGLIRTPKQTEGLGYTDELGIYRIETIPKGKYFVEVSANDGSKYSLESEEIEIISGELTVIRFELGPKINGIKFKGE